MQTLQSILESENLNISHNQFGTDKGDRKSYVDKFYESTFAPRRNDPVRVLEIGFRHGASLALWAKYFKNGHVVGLDNMSQNAIKIKTWTELPNVCTLIGDAYDADFAANVPGHFDVIIDDGPHTLASQQRAIELYLSRLKSGGIFVIEDILAGGTSIRELLAKVPPGFTARFRDFRLHRHVGDNCLFVITHGNSSRVPLVLLGLLYEIVEGPARALKKALT